MRGNLKNHRRILRFPFPVSAASAVGLFLVLSVLFPLLSGALDVPKLQGYVNDYAGMISPQTKTELERELAAFERTDSTQIMILTVPSLEGDAVEDFGIKVAEAWRIGQKGKDNGVIFIVARQEKKMRIEVGRGLEGRLTDLMAGRVIDLVVKPRFKRGDFDGGFIAGVSSLVDATRGEFKADRTQPSRKHERSSKLLTLLIFGGIAMLVLGSMSRVLGGVSGAVGLPVLAHFAGFPLGIAALGILVVLGFGAGLFLPMLFSAGGRYRGGGFGPGGGFFGMGGGGFGGGGDSGGGDFGGGGGGDFGGGGASGDW